MAATATAGAGVTVLVARGCVVYSVVLEATGANATVVLSDLGATVPRHGMRVAVNGESATHTFGEGIHFAQNCTATTANGTVWIEYI